MTGMPSQDLAAPLPLLCRLGRHAPQRLPIWNDGYYFSTCRRCRRDIVRPLDGGWQLPRGYRVVWRRERPAGEGAPVLAVGAEAARLPPSPAEAPPEPIGPDPVVAVDQAGEQAEAPSPPAPSSAASAEIVDASAASAEIVDVPAAVSENPPGRRSSAIPDFMAETAPLWTPVAPRSLVGGDIEPQLARGARGELEGIGLVNLAAMSNRVFRRRDAAVDPSPRRAMLWAAAMPVAIVAAVAITYSLAHDRPAATQPVAARSIARPGLYIVPPEPDGMGNAASRRAGSAATTRPTRAAKGAASSTGGRVDDRPPRQEAAINQMVTASVLNCRTSPSTASPVIMKMLRGAVVATSDRRRDWAYVTRHGHSCWVQADLLER